MAFAAMFIAGVFIVVVLIGLFILLIGIILDIIWGVRKKKKKRTHPVLKVFAVLLTVVGILMGIGPIAGVGAMTLSSKMKYKAEISDLPKDSQIHIDSMDDVMDGFDFKGVHYVSFEGLHPQVSQECFKENKVGAFITDKNGDHKLIYSVENTMGISILHLANYTQLYIEESEVDNILDYYVNEAPLFCVSYDHDEAVTYNDVDSDHVRAIVDLVETKGSKSGLSSDGFMIFYSTDGLYCVDFRYKIEGDEVYIESGSDSMMLEGDDAEFIKSFIE